ncbi:MAG: hypothetical protein MUF54_03330 [Polyangiaceae bacterium]|nr:hypothetical protein [Polyangiaceae bacterium]
MVSQDQTHRYHLALSRARRAQRGAAIFVVMLVLTVLAGVGMFAAHAAGLNQRLSGYARQATQSEYVADYGTIAAIDELSAGTANDYMQLVLAGEESCRANQYITSAPPNLPCYRITKTDITKRMASEPNAAEAMFDPSGGSLSAAALPVGADFAVELTDPGPAGRPVAGMDQSGVGPRFRYMQVTFSGVGQVRPQDGSDNMVAKMSAVRANRAVVQVGPLPQ